MRAGSRLSMFRDRVKNGTFLTVTMTASTGLSLTLCIDYHTPGVVKWGDGTESAGSGQNLKVSHTYPAYGDYVINLEGVRSVGFRTLDGQPQCTWDAAVTSLIDNTGSIVSSRSAAFKRAVNLEEVYLPECTWLGQRDFAYCSKLKSVYIPKSEICYDGTFQNCTSLETVEPMVGGTFWSYVFMGCTSLRTLTLTGITQFATQDFANTGLTDIYLPGKYKAQLKGTADYGNIVHGYGAVFPWGASSSCRFHCEDGILLGGE